MPHVKGIAACSVFDGGQRQILVGMHVQAVSGSSESSRALQQGVRSGAP